MVRFIGELKIEARNRNGEIESVCQGACHSFVRQFLDLLLLRMGGIDRAGVIDITNTTRTLQYATTVGFRMYGAVGDDGNGIVVGTGNTAVTISDISLANFIAAGGGVGQLTYNAQTADVDVTTTATQVTFTFQRTFNNGSGGSITIREVGIYAEQRDNSGINRVFLVNRDVPTAVLVPNGGAATVTYTFTITE